MQRFRFAARAVLATTVAGLVAVAQPAWAQSSPSASQILDALKPRGNVLGGSTRGIRPAGPATTAAPSAEATSATNPAPSHTAAPHSRTALAAPVADGPSIDLSVQFATGSADLTPQAMHVLDELGKALSDAQLSGSAFRIEGHTDTVGSAEVNKTLSERRAEAVVSYLSTKFGVSPSRLQAVGMGEDGLLVQTPPQTPEARNRRVHVVNLNG